MARTRTGRNILGGLVAAAVITAAVGAVTWSAVGRLSRAMDELVDRAYPAVLALVELDAGVGEARRSLNGMTSDRYMTDRALRDALRKRLESGLSRIAAARADFEAHADLDAAEQARWRTVTAGLDAWLAAVDDFSTQAWARPPDSAEPPVDDALWRAFLGLREKHDRFAKPLAEALATAREHAVLDRGAAQAEARRDIALVAVLVLLGAVATVAVGLWLARRADRVVAALRAQAGALRDAVRQGKLDVRGDPAAVEGDFRPVVEGMNETMDAFARPIAVTADYVTRIARGDLPPPIAEDYAGDFNRIKVALNGCVASLSALTGGLQAMTRDQLAGDHEAYVDPARFEGTYRALAEGVRANVRHHVDSVLEILQTVQAYADGDFSRTVRRFPGKQAVAHETVDAVRDNLRAVAAEVRTLTEATLAGRLGVRADAARLRGDWAALVKGVNDALDAVVGPFRVVAEYCDRISHGDLPPRRTKEVPGELAAIQASLNRCLDAVGVLVADAEGLAEAAVAGRLATRADAARHEGAFRAAIDGVNRTLDAVVAPVNEAAGVLERLARRDLTVRVRGDHRGDHARIQDAVNATAEALHDALAQVASAVEQVSSAAAQIAASSQAVASGASEQASSLEETSSSIESVAGMTRAATDSAQQANGLALSARTAATEGAAAVEQMQGAMSRIKASSEGTSQIIKDVSEIAFQTNLLALNAAVEAARAGEAGRGFAVVAEEVRSLALRAKEAATKTEELIRQSVKEANEGERTARHVAGKLEEIVGGVSKVTAVVGEIAASAREQATGIDQVTRAVSEMDRVTQQNAASAEESSSAASELSGQAEELAAMVGSFRLDRGEAGTGPAAPSRPGRLLARA